MFVTTALTQLGQKFWPTRPHYGDEYNRLHVSGQLPTERLALYDKAIAAGEHDLERLRTFTNITTRHAARRNLFSLLGSFPILVAAGALNCGPLALVGLVGLAGSVILAFGNIARCQVAGHEYPSDQQQLNRLQVMRYNVLEQPNAPATAQDWSLVDGWSHPRVAED